MTVSNQIKKVTGVGNGVAFDFSFSPMQIFASTDLQVAHVVLATGVETLLTEGTGASNYSVTVAQYPGTGKVTYPADESTALPVGENIIIKRVLTLEQQVNLENQGGYFPDTQEKALDRLTMLDLQQQEEIDRSIAFVLSADLSGFDAELPTPVGAGGKVVALKADESGFEFLTPNNGAYIAISAFGETLVEAVDASAALTVLGVSAFGKTLIDDANAAAARTTLELGTAAVLDAGTSENNLVQLGAGGALPAIPGGNLTGIKVINVQEFTSSETWTKPDGASLLMIEIIGAAGGGARRSSGNGSGGGPGSYYRMFMLASDAGATETVTIGAGGAVQTTDNTAGNNGGNTSFGSHVTMYGGRGGSHNAVGNNVAGGGASAVADIWSAGANYNVSLDFINGGTNGTTTTRWGASASGTTSTNAVQITPARFAIDGGAGGAGHSTSGPASGTAATSLNAGNGGNGNGGGAGGNGASPGGGGGSGTTQGGSGGNGFIRVTAIG